MTERFTYRVDDEGLEKRQAEPKLRWSDAMHAIIVTLGDDEMSEAEIRAASPNNDSGIGYALGQLMELGCVVRIDHEEGMHVDPDAA